MKKFPDYIILPVILLCAFFLRVNVGSASPQFIDLDDSEIVGDTISSDFSQSYRNISRRIEKIFQKLAVENPEHIKYWQTNMPGLGEEDENVTLALISISRQEWGNAERHLNAVGKENKYYPSSLYLLGWVYFKSEQYNEAAAVFSELLNEYNSEQYNTIETSFMLGLSLYREKKYKESWEQFAASVRFYEKEIELIKKVLEKLNSQDYGNFLKQILFKYENDEIPDILKRFLHSKESISFYRYLDFFQHIEKETPPSLTEDINDELSSIFFVLKEELESRYGWITDGYDAFPGWIEYYRAKSLYNHYLRNKDDRDLRIKAIDTHERVIKKYSNWNDSLIKETINRLIELHYDEDGFSNDSIKLYTMLTGKRFSSDPDTVHALYELGVGYFENKFYKNAKKVFTKLKKKFPKSVYSPDIFFRLGEIYLRKGDIDRSVLYFKKASAYPHSYYSFVSLYRRGWIEYMLSHYENAIGLLGELSEYINRYKSGDLEIKNAEEEKGLEGLIARLKDESEGIIVTSLYELGGTEKLFAFLNENSNKPYVSYILISLGNIYHMQKDYISEIKLYSDFLDIFFHRPEAGEVITRLIKSYNRANLHEYAEKVRSILISFYDKAADSKHKDTFKDIVFNAYLESARYHYTLAKEKDDPVEYDRTIELYRRYIKRFKGEKAAHEANFYLAEALYEKGEYSGAAAEYSKTAWRYPSYSDPAIKEKAAIGAVMSAEKELETDHAPVRKKLNRFYRAAELFISNFPDSRRVPDIALRVGEHRYNEKKYKKAIEVFENITGMKADRKITTKSLQRLAQSYFHDENYESAGDGFYRLMRFTLSFLLQYPANTKNVLFKVGNSYYPKNRYEEFTRSLYRQTGKEWGDALKVRLWHRINQNESIDSLLEQKEKNFIELVSPFKKNNREILLLSKEMVLLSIVKEAEKLLSADKFADAADAFMTGAALTSALDARIDYLYKCAAAYIKTEQWGKAYNIINLIVDSYQDRITDKYSMFMQLAYVSNRLDRKEKVAYALKKIVSLNGIDAEKRRNAAFKAGLAFESMGNDDEAALMLAAYILESRSSADKYIEASFRAGEIYERLGSPDKARKYYSKAIRAYKKRKYKKEGVYFAARAHFNLGERDFEKFQGITISGNIRKKMDIKKSMLKKLIRNYKNIIDYGMLELVSASYHRSGMAYEGFAQAIEDSPSPAGLSASEIKKYKKILARKVAPLKKRAIEAYKQNITLSARKKYNEWITLSIKAFARLNNNFTFKEETVVGLEKKKPALSLLQFDFFSDPMVSDFEPYEQNSNRLRVQGSSAILNGEL